MISYAACDDGVLKRTFIHVVERLSGQSRLARACEEARRTLHQGDSIWAAAVTELRLKLRYDPLRLASVPRDGPLVVVANHPFGLVDGLALCHLVSMMRSDFKVVAMSTLCRVPEVRDHVLPINFAGTREAILTSARSRRAARLHLGQGGCLTIFPAGAVSTANKIYGPADDAPWHPFAGRLIIDHRATVLPVRFAGQNSRLFHLASRVSPTLRLSLLMREAARRIGREIDIRLGDLQQFEALSNFKQPEVLIRHLRQLTYATLPAPASADL